MLAVQDLCLRKLLQLMHPLTPFISEELFHLLGCAGEGDYIQNSNPGDGEALAGVLAKVGIALDPAAVAATAALREFVSGARAIKSQNNQATKRDSKLKFAARDEASRTLVESNLDKIKKLVGAAEVEFVTEASGGPAAVTPLGTVALDLTGSVDAAAEKARLSKEIEKLDKLIASSEAKLSNEAFTSKAPAHILEGARNQLAETKAKRDEFARIIASLG